ncbi:transposase [uncultured Tateyamaria sp.]|uniref:transposase n=1 Tax=uncultured Tateyamaria sp. TaxID=455651 RepID=UPI0026295035|nr:transposase [uncultured Tateyamaria sp.]
MARKRYSDEGILRLLREVELSLSPCPDVASAYRTAGASDATYYTWHKQFGGMGRSEMANLKALQKENDRLKKIVAELELDKLIPKKSLDCLKPRV